MRGVGIHGLISAMTSIKTSLIVALAQNNCIGKENRMPWHISADLKRFKELTMGHPVIMGRKTFESILGYLGKPLPGRKNIVISRAGFQSAYSDVSLYQSVHSSIEAAKEEGKAEVFVIGGAQIYEQTLPLADRLYLTQVHRDVDGDAFFPEIDMAQWWETARQDHLDHDPPFSFINLERR